MDFEREKPQCKFSIPDRPTVRQQLEYYSLAGAAHDRDMLLRYWEGAKSLIEKWECVIVPKHKEFDPDREDNPEVATLILWAGLQVRNYMNSLENIPKNS